MKGTCINCGGDEGIHHYQTMQCPVGGVEAPIDHKQQYRTTTFESNEVQDELSMLRIQLENLVERVKRIEEMFPSVMEIK